MNYPPAEWITCHGEAHENPYIDHCMVCMPWWEKYPICPKCRTKLAKGKKCLQCIDCHRRYSLTEGMTRDERVISATTDRQDPGGNGNQARNLQNVQ